MLVAVFGRPRRNGSPVLRALLIAAGVLLALAVAGGLCAKCREHMACCAREDDVTGAEDEDREDVLVEDSEAQGTADEVGEQSESA